MVFFLFVLWVGVSRDSYYGKAPTRFFLCIFSQGSEYSEAPLGNFLDVGAPF